MLQIHFKCIIKIFIYRIFIIFNSHFFIVQSADSLQVMQNVSEWLSKSILSRIDRDI